MPEPASFLISIRELEESLVLPSSARLPLASEPFIEFLAKLGEPLTLTRERENNQLMQSSMKVLTIYARQPLVLHRSKIFHPLLL